MERWGSASAHMTAVRCKPPSSSRRPAPLEKRRCPCGRRSRETRPRAGPCSARPGAPPGGRPGRARADRRSPPGPGSGQGGAREVRVPPRHGVTPDVHEQGTPLSLSSSTSSWMPRWNGRRYRRLRSSQPARRAPGPGPAPSPGRIGRCRRSGYHRAGGRLRGSERARAQRDHPPALADPPPCPHPGRGVGCPGLGLHRLCPPECRPAAEHPAHLHRFPAGRPRPLLRIREGDQSEPRSAGP